MEAKVRRAIPSDKEPLMSFIKDVWGGHDYIPKVWDDWMKDRNGEMFVVEVGGVPVGMNRVRFLEDGSAWFEGARVHPDLRGRGLASMLGRNSMEVARAKGIKVFRLTSGSRNWTAHRQISRIRFRETARFTVYEPRDGAAVRPKVGATRMTQGDFDEVVRLVEGSKEYRLGGGVFWDDWSAASLARPVLRALLAEGAVWREGEAVAVTREGGEGPDRWEQVCFIGGQAGDASKLVKSLLGRNRKAEERWVFLPQGSPIVSRLRAEGYRRHFSMVLFERTAANG